MNVDPWIDPTTEAVRAIHLEPLVEWLTRRWLGPEPVRILDLGCGDMLLARLVPPGHVVDGYDPSPAARDAARAAGRRWDMSGAVFDDPDDVPLGVYDGVVISSVLQYLSDEDALTAMLQDVGRWLRPAGALGTVATDVPVPGERRLSDARDLAVGLTRRLGPLGATRELVRATRRSPGGLRSFAEADVETCALRAGMTAERLVTNLSPFRARATYHFVRF
jgi:SAM-dependent methyltransferase